MGSLIKLGVRQIAWPLIIFMCPLVYSLGIIICFNYCRLMPLTKVEPFTTASSLSRAMTSRFHSAH